jgi:hypothetical protein
MCSTGTLLYLNVDTAFQRTPNVFTSAGFKAQQGRPVVLLPLLTVSPVACPGIVPAYALPPLGAMVGLPGAQ